MYEDIFDELGDTAEEVRANLLRFGCKVKPLDSAACPIGVYLHSKLQDEFERMGFSVFSTIHGVYKGENNV